MHLDEFFKYKNKLMEDILTTPSIVDLISPGIKPAQIHDLAYRPVFPYEFVPDTVEQGETFICFDVDIQKSVNKTYLLPTLYVWVFTHKSLLRLPEGGVRTDRLCSEICKKINGSKEYGLGDLDLYSVKRFAPMTDYQGKCLTFYATDFNRIYDPNKKIPKDRKL